MASSGTGRNDLRLIVKVAKLYHHEHRTQQQIATLLKLSRPKVSRLLSEAKRRRILTVVISEPTGIHAELEAKLEKVLGFREAVLVSSGNELENRRAIGSAAAHLLQRILDENDTVGISWGSTLAAVADALLPSPRPGADVVQLIGGLGEPQAESHASDIARKASLAFGGRLFVLPAPGIVADAQSKRVLEADPQIATTLAKAAKATVALVGIGSLVPEPKLLLESGLVTPHDLALLREKGAVGDVALRFFDAAGSEVTSELTDRVIGLDAAGLRGIPTIVAVATGQQKVQPILGALRSGLISVLITDTETAEAVLKLNGRSNTE